MAYLENIEDILMELSEPAVIRNIDLARSALTRVQDLANAGCETKQLFPAVVKYLVSPDLLIKKLACWFVSHHCNQPNLLLLAVNTLVTDSTHPNPVVRGLALKTLSKLPQPSFVEYWGQACISCLQDPSAYVRRAAVMACIRLNDIDSSYLDNNDAVDILYRMVRDQDPVVVVNALRALEEILSEEGGVVVNRNMTLYLLNHLKNFSDWDLVAIFSILMKYTPRSDEEALDIMNVCDGYFKHLNSAVMLGVWQYFVHLIHSMPHLKGEVNKRAKSHVLRFISSSNTELAMAMLEYIEPIIMSDAEIFRDKYKHFFTKYVEPVCVRVKKINLLTYFVNNENISAILEEMMLCCLDIREEVSSAGISATGKIANMFPETQTVCVNKLLSLCESQEEHLCCYVLCAIRNLEIKESHLLKSTLDCVSSCVPFVEKNEGKEAIICLLGEYGEHMEKSVYLLEHFANLIEDESLVNLMMPLLTSAVKLFLKKPAECQKLLSLVLELSMSCPNMDVRDQGHLYYQLLKHDVKTAKLIVIKNSL